MAQIGAIFLRSDAHALDAAGIGVKHLDLELARSGNDFAALANHLATQYASLGPAPNDSAPAVGTRTTTALRPPRIRRILRRLILTLILALLLLAAWHWSQLLNFK